MFISGIALGIIIEINHCLCKEEEAYNRLISGIAMFWVELLSLLSQPFGAWLGCMCCTGTGIKSTLHHACMS